MDSSAASATDRIRGASTADSKDTSLCTGLKRRWVIDPRTNKWLPYWDIVTSVALLFTLAVTPAEVSFLPALSPGEKWTNALFLTNRAVDVVFLLDMLLQFRVAYKSGGIHEGTRWHTAASDISSNYLRSKWFYIDFFSVLTSLFDILGDEDTKDLSVLRAVRVLRLAKLIRLARGSRIIKTWEMHLSINYAYLSLAQLTAAIFVVVHWAACLWGLQASFDYLNSWPGGTGHCMRWGEGTFLDDMEPECPSKYPSAPDGDDTSAVCYNECSAINATHIHCSKGWICVGPWPMYSISLYFSVMTITSVGYGDVLAMPFNETEQVICSIIMLGSGMMWGYLIGTFCGLAANLSPSVQQFREELSQLNDFMSKYDIDAPTRLRLREYFHETVHLRDSENRTKLLKKLSPAMQGEVSWVVNQCWIRRVWYLKEMQHRGLMIELAAHLQPLVFPPLEFAPSNYM